jgi:diguanylate cyclase (GGDEF)-like protein
VDVVTAGGGADAPAAATALVAGGASDLAAWLAARLDGASVDAAADAQAALARLGARPPRVLVLHDGLPGAGRDELLRLTRTHLPPDRLGVVCCIDPGGDNERARRLVEELGVQRVLVQPAEPLEVAQAVASLLGLPPPPAADDPLARARGALAGIRDRYRGRAIEHIETLERLALALLEGAVDPDLLEEGRRAAHKLTGSMGTFGYFEGSRLGAALEQALNAGVGPDDAARIAEAAVALRGQLEAGPQEEAPPPAEADERRTLLLVGLESEMADRVAAEAAGRGIACRAVPDAVAARAALASIHPDVVLIDVGDGPGGGGAEALLEELAARNPPVPVLVLTEAGALVDRVQIARLGAQRFLRKPLAPAQAIEAATLLLERARPQDSSVLAVDDDPAVLDALRALLEQEGLRVTTLEDPLRFWDALEAAAPDVIVLDVDMPGLSGIELCRVLRSDGRWVGTPVLVLTARADRETVQSVFAAGADDFVSKPIVGPELVTRITNRLDRARLQASLAEVDPLTGVANRRHSSQSLGQLIHLVDRFRQPLSLGLIDVDGLKRINDLQGHAAGDRILRRLGSRLLRAFDGDDVVGRWGGEFVVGMPGLGRLGGTQRLTAVLGAFRAETFQAPDGTPFTASFTAGVAEYPVDGSDLHALYRAADGALARAKEAGRARVVPAGWRSDGAALEVVDVAVVEDDESLSQLLLHALETRGHTTRWIADGREAAEALAGGGGLTARVVLLDWDLPGLDGLSVLRALAEAGVLRRSRVVMLTVRATEAEVLRTLALGAFDHVAKPFSVPVLMQRVERALTT